jgi:hypothetical protein
MKLGIAAVALLFFIPVAHADSVANVTFAGVAESCAPAADNSTVCTEVWSGTFSIDLTTGALLSSSISGVGPAAGPWTGAGVLICEPGGIDCNTAWSDAAGLDIEWDPGDYEETVLTSSSIAFFTEGIHPTFATSYSVLVPEPPLFALTLAGLLALALLKRRVPVQSGM